MMTPLRQRMQELQRRNYCSGTIRLYLRHVADFAQHFHRSPDQLGAEQIRQFPHSAEEAGLVKLQPDRLCFAHKGDPWTETLIYEFQGKGGNDGESLGPHDAGP